MAFSLPPLAAARTIARVDAALGRKPLPPLKPRVLPAVRFALVYADPGWKYVQGGRGAINTRYTQSGPNAIHGLDVPSIVEDNAVLFLWGTWPQLPIVMDTFPAWGFEYKTNAFLWVKYHQKSGKRCVGGGFWTRANTEFCLIGVRGKNHPKRVDKAIRQLIETDDDEKVILAPRQEHSAKPPEARTRIVQLMGELPRIELYARERTPGWAVWGDDKRLGKPDVDLQIRRELP